LREKFPKTPINSDIMLDSETGKVRVYSDGKDITPSRFAETAESRARQYLISLLSQSPQTPALKYSFPKLPEFSGFFRIITNLFYWGYNLMFAFGAAIWLLTLVSSHQFNFIKLFSAFVLLAVPVCSLVLSVTRRIYQKSGQLLRIFILVEIPLLLISFIATSLPDSANRFLLFILFNLFLIPIILIAPHFSKLSSKIALILTFFKTMTLMVWGYITILFSFIFPKLVTEIFSAIFGNLSLYHRYPSYDYYGGYQSPILDPGSIFSFLIQIGWGLIIFAFWLAVILIPYMIFMLLYRSFRRGELTKFHALFAVIVFTIFVGLSYQPGFGKLIQPLKTLSSVSASFADKETAAQSLISQESKIKKLIANVNEVRYSYPFHQDEHIFDSEIINSLFLKIAYPFVYQGPTSTYELQNAYNLLFGTYQTSLSPSSKLVLLSYRKVSVVPTPQEALAEITIEEEYDNQTNSQQEVIYEFSLYPGSVITSLRLGPDLEFPGVIAPKGAAQKTYESQIRINRDPALLEQIGANSYRLRVFPIPANRDFNTLKGKHQKVAFTYTTSATANGFPLPVYSRQTNVYSTSASTYLLAKGNQLTKMDVSDKYLPSAFSPCQSRLDPGDLVQITCAHPILVSGKKVAILLDVSLKNKSSPNLNQLIQFAKDHPEFFDTNKVDLYKYNTAVSDPQVLTSPITPATLSSLVFWGQSDLNSALSKITRSYDAVFIISGSSTPLPASTRYPFSLSTPAYFIHPQTPAYSLEFTSRILQSGGLISNSWDDSIDQYFFSQNLPSDSYLVNKYFYLKNLPKLVPATGTLGNLSNYGQLMKYVQSTPTNLVNDITKMDELNTFAQKASLVTPYSSLISLVNVQQQQILQNFENQYNRYEDTAMRESTTTQPFMPAPRLNNPVPTMDLFGSAKLTNDSSGTLSLGLPSVGGGITANPSFSSFAAADSGGSLPSVFTLLLLPLLIVFPLCFVYFIIKSIRQKKS